MKEETLYKDEQRLLTELVKTQESGEKEYQNALKREIGRLNKNMDSLEPSLF